MGLAERLAVRARQHMTTCARCRRSFSQLRIARARAGRGRTYEVKLRRKKFCSVRCYRKFIADQNRDAAEKAAPAQGPLLRGKLSADEQRFSEENGAELTAAEFQRPRSRTQCENGLRPCPWVSCRYNLYLDVTPSGSIRVNLPIVVEDMRESCALDFDDRPLTQEQIGELFGLSRQRVQQIEETTIRRIASSPAITARLIWRKHAR